MKGDFTQTTFKPEKHYRSVRTQQGRVQLDSDWNEQLDIDEHRVQTEAIDTIGECGGSIHHGGYRIVSDKNELTSDEKAALLEDFSTLTLDQGDFLITAGRYYIDGILSENEETVLYSRQTDLPGAGPISEDGYYLVYLHVWERHITRLEDPDIREVALGGPDTATRVKTVWQVRYMRVGGLADNLTDCSRFGSDWIPPQDPASSGVDRAMLRARSNPQAVTEELCIVPPQAGYQRLENQLYRVEVHQGTGHPDGPTFKWSRENGSVVARLEDIKGDVVMVSEPGKDEVLGFGPGQWVELNDEQRVLHGQPGVLVKLRQVQGKELTVDSWPGGSALTMADFSGLPSVRRWDMPSSASGALEIDALSGDYQDLEGGVQVQFGGQEFRSGDYWMIPARTVLGDILWPGNGQPAAREPQGINHHFCPLALVRFDSSEPDPGITVVHDCRDLFAPLTEQLRFFHVGGSGQESMPGQRVEQPLQVGVSNGQWPVVGAKVRFERVPDQNGIDGGTLFNNGDSGPSVVAATDSTGIAACEWELDGDRQHHSQRVVATLLTPAEVALDDVVPVAFNANLSIASQVSYQDSNQCLNPATPTTVKDALDDLCENFTIYYVSGEGQEITPVAPLNRLPVSLEVRVANGGWPVADTRASVRFEVVDGNGRVAVVGELPSDPTIDVELEVTGRAACDWHVDNSSPNQQVAATLVDRNGDPVPRVTPIRFNARLSQNLGTEPGVGIKDVVSAGDQTPLLHDDLVEVSRLAEGIDIVCDAELSVESGGGPPTDPASSFPDETVASKPTCFLTLDLPYPLGAEKGFWGFGEVAGFRPLHLGGGVSIQENVLGWRPTEAAARWLQQNLFQRLSDEEVADRVLAHLTVKGNFVWRSEAGSNPGLYLDGEAFGRPGKDGRIDLGFPIGDGVRGGDFEMWFWLVPAVAAAPNLAVNFTTTETTITGTVSAIGGNVQPGVRVSITHQTTGARVVSKTNAAGDFVFLGVPGGAYALVAQLAGFKPALSTLSISGRTSPIAPAFDPRNFPGRELEEVNGIGPAFKALLEGQGITHPAELASMEPTRLAGMLTVSPTRAQKFIQAARILLSR